MKLTEIVKRLAVETLAPIADPETEITGGYCGDLLSHVLASASPGDLWITIQHHGNVVAVAQVAGLKAIVLADGRRPDQAVLAQARAGGIAIFGSTASAFDLAGKLYGMLTDER